MGFICKIQALNKIIQMQNIRGHLAKKWSCYSKILLGPLNFIGIRDLANIVVFTDFGGYFEIGATGTIF